MTPEVSLKLKELGLSVRNIQEIFESLVMVKSKADNGEDIFTWYGKQGEKEFWGMGWTRDKALVDFLTRWGNSRGWHPHTVDEIVEATALSKITVQEYLFNGVRKLRKISLQRIGPRFTPEFLRSYYIK